MEQDDEMLEDVFFIHDAITAKIESLTTFLEYAKTNCSTDTIEATERDLEAAKLEQSNKSKTPTVKEEAKSLQAACTERTRIITQNELWKEQNAAKKTKAISEITRYQNMREQKIREEEERHQLQIESLKTDYEYYIEREQTTIDKCDEDEAEKAKVVEDDVAKINELTKQIFSGGEDTAEAATATVVPPKPRVATLTSDMLTPEVVAKHMSTDANLIGMNEGQALAMMTSMFTLFQNLTQPQQQQAAAGSNDMQPTTTQPQPPQQQQQQQGAKGGAEVETEVSSDEEESGDEAKMVLVQSKNKARKARREKAAAVKGGGKGVAKTT